MSTGRASLNFLKIPISKTKEPNSIRHCASFLFNLLIVVINLLNRDGR